MYLAYSKGQRRVIPSLNLVFAEVDKLWEALIRYGVGGYDSS